MKSENNYKILFTRSKVDIKDWSSWATNMKAKGVHRYLHIANILDAYNNKNGLTSTSLALIDVVYYVDLHFRRYIMGAIQHFEVELKAMLMKVITNNYDVLAIKSEKVIDSILSECSFQISILKKNANKKLQLQKNVIYLFKKAEKFGEENIGNDFWISDWIEELTFGDMVSLCAALSFNPIFASTPTFSTKIDYNTMDTYLATLNDFRNKSAHHNNYPEKIKSYYIKGVAQSIEYKDFLIIVLKYYKDNETPFTWFVEKLKNTLVEASKRKGYDKKIIDDLFIPSALKKYF